MKLLKLVIVDDEAILLQGLLHTYDWKEMGFEVVGTAQSGKQAIDVIRKVRPHVVLTDIRMKQITGLMVMKTIQKAGLNCLFMCALRRTFLTGESPQSALVVGRIQPRPRVSTVRWNLKEGGGKSLV